MQRFLCLSHRGWHFRAATALNRHRLNQQCNGVALTAVVRSYRASSAFNSYNPSNVPNPVTSPLDAGRLTKEPSCISDPKKILKHETKEKIDGLLQNIHNEVAVVVIDKIDENYMKLNKNDAIESFADELHTKWGVGDDHKKDGILLMLSTQDRLIYLSLGIGVANVTTYSGQYLVNNVRDFLKSENYDKAIEHIIVELDRILRNNISEEELKAKESAKKKQEKQKIFQKVFFRGFTYLGLMAILYVMTLDESAPLESSLLEKAHVDLERIFEDDDISCPCCLQSYDSKNSKIIMTCGHRYCQSCYNRITKQTKQCLYCSDVLKPQQEGSVPIRSGTGKPSERLARYAYIYAEVVSPEDLENLKNSINESVVIGKAALFKLKIKLRNEINRIRQEKSVKK